MGGYDRPSEWDIRTSVRMKQDMYDPLMLHALRREISVPELVREICAAWLTEHPYRARSRYGATVEELAHGAAEAPMG